MSAGYHECRCTKCTIAVRADETLPHVVNVPLRPLGETMHRQLLFALAQNPIVLRDNERQAA